jgi:hypothetical protein
MNGIASSRLIIAGALLVGCNAQPDDRTASLDQASSVHLKGGKSAEPAFRDLGSALRASGSLSGLGGGDVYVSLDATAEAIVTCQNPGNGEHYPPGQDPADIDVSGATVIPEDELKNGTTPFSVTTVPPPPTIAGAPDCPGASWTEHLVDLAFLTATITIEQPLGTTVLMLDCTFTPKTANGSVPAATVVCE